MEELLKNKLEAANELRNFTKEIMDLSLKTEYDKVNFMIDQRLQFIEKINAINEKIKNCSFEETCEIKEIKNEIRETFKEIADMDNLIRKNLNEELKDVKKNLNQPEVTTKLINIKA